MQQTCHRCSSTVSREDVFCPVCGAAQVNFDESDQPVFGENGGENSDTPAAQGRPGQISWKLVLGGCAKFAIPAGVLCSLPLISTVSLLWIVGGATAVILLYRRRRPLALITARNGFRIGALAGLITAYVSIAVSALLRVLQRYPMHLGKVIDADYETAMRESYTAFGAMFQNSPTLQAQLQESFHYLLSMDGRAASSLTTILTNTIFSILFAAIAGAASVRLSATRRTA